MRYFLLLLCLTPSTAFAMDGHHSTLFHGFTLETDIGHSREEGTLGTWDLDGWMGGDYNKFWVKSEGEAVEGTNTSAEFWGVYSRNVAEFWDIQAGIRYDARPDATTYLVAGVQGLAKYYFETEAHLFISDEGDVSARIREENDFLITQRLIIQPYAEANFYAQDVPDQEVGAGFANAEFGIQTRYEITRKFAPYVDISYETSFGETASIARANGESRDDVVASIGLRLMF